jgi:hypothetical protein
MSRIDRIQRADTARRVYKAVANRSEGTEATGASNLPVPVTPVAAPRTFRDERPRGYAEFAAQVIGQRGERRGLRAGPSLLEHARDAYNRTEWSGTADRRARKGRSTREEI